MRPIRLLVFYLAFIFVGAALVSPWVYKLVPTGAPFHRYVHRCLLVLALAGLWPFLRGLGIRSWRNLGFVSPQKNWKNLGAGFLLGFVSLAILAALAIFFGGREWNFNATAMAFAGKLFAATLTAIVVAVLEETLFRGALFGMLRKSISWPAALAVSSAVYAIAHFFAKPELPPSVNWLSGFAALGGMLRGFADFEALVPGFFNLLIVGGILALAYQRTGNLFFSIGLHAGWIFWLKSYGMLTARAANANAAFWGGAKMIDGWLATIVLAAVFLIVIFHFRGKKSASNGTD